MSSAAPSGRLARMNARAKRDFPAPKGPFRRTQSPGSELLAMARANATVLSSEGRSSVTLSLFMKRSIHACERAVPVTSSKEVDENRPLLRGFHNF